MRDLISKITTSKITRKQFLQYMGIMVITIIGLPAIVKLAAELVSGESAKDREILSIIPKNADNKLYGEGPYGV